MTNQAQNTENQDNKSKYIIPTKEKPVFKAECDFFGYIDGPYKDHIIGNCVSNTFGVDFAMSINYLHKWIKDSDAINNWPKCKFNLYVIDGSTDKYGDPVMKKVYTISASKAKKYLF